MTRLLSCAMPAVAVLKFCRRKKKKAGPSLGYKASPYSLKEAGFEVLAYCVPSLLAKEIKPLFLFHTISVQHRRQDFGITCKPFSGGVYLWFSLKSK